MPLEAHHIIPKCVAENLTLETDNGITLCKNCHKRTLGYISEYSVEFLRAQIYTLPITMNNLPQGLKKERKEPREKGANEKPREAKERAAKIS